MREENFERCSSTGKRCYSEKEANIALSCLKKNYVSKMYMKKRTRKSPNGKIPKRKYFCKDCGWWHLTSNVTSKENSFTKKKKKYIKTFNYQSIKNY